MPRYGKVGTNLIRNLKPNSVSFLSNLNRTLPTHWQHIVDILIMNRDAYIQSGGARPAGVTPPTRLDLTEGLIHPNNVTGGIINGGRGDWCLTDCELSLCIWDKYRNLNIMKILRTYSTCVPKLMAELPIIWEIADKTGNKGYGNNVKARAIELIPSSQLDLNAVVKHFDNKIEEKKENEKKAAEKRAKKKKEASEAITRPLFQDNEGL